MTNKPRWLLVLLTVALLLVLWFLFPRRFRSDRSAAVPAVNPPVMTPAGRQELEKFQGGWEFVSLEVDGDQKPDADFKKYSVLFRDDQWIVSEGTNIAAQLTIVLDPTTNPKSFDGYPPPGKGQPIHGIYAIEGDKLTACDRGEDHGDRPTEFSTEPNSGLVLFVYKRLQH